MSNNTDMDQVKRNLVETDKIHNKYNFEACIDRNVILIGRSRTGKSTIAEVLGDVFYMARETDLYTETNSTEFHKFISPIIDNGMRAFLTIVDTPGFFAISKSGSSQPIIRDNLAVRKFIDLCIAHDVTNVHFFALTINLLGGINQEDIGTMIYVQQHYHYLSSHAALIITHCEEEIDPMRREYMINNLFEHSDLVQRDLKSFFKKGIFFMGAIRHLCYVNQDAGALTREYKQVSIMRTELIEKIIASEIPFNIGENKAGQCNIF